MDVWSPLCKCVEFFSIEWSHIYFYFSSVLPYKSRTAFMASWGTVAWVCPHGGQYGRWAFGAPTRELRGTPGAAAAPAAAGGARPGPRGAGRAFGWGKAELPVEWKAEQGKWVICSSDSNVKWAKLACQRSPCLAGTRAVWGLDFVQMNAQIYNKKKKSLEGKF